MSFKRTYNSQSTATGILGYGWNDSLSEKLDISLIPDTIILIQEGGRHVYFNNNGAGAWINETSKVRTITTTTGGYQLIEPDGAIHIYDTDGKLQEKQDYRNNSLFFSYNTSTQKLESIHDDFGRSITLEYYESGSSIGLLRKLITPVGDFFYEYDTDLNLQYVTKPDSTRIEYKYGEDTIDIHNLTGIVGENLNRIQTIRYDSNDRAIQSWFGDDTNYDPARDNEKEEEITIDYLANLERDITQTKEGGTIVSHYVLEAINGVVRVKSFTGPAACSCGTQTGASYLYDDRQHVVQITKPTNNPALGDIVTTYGYDPNTGNRISKTETATGASGQRTTTWTYEPGSGRIASITKASVANPGQNAVTTFDHTYDAQGLLDTKTVTETGYNGIKSPVSRVTVYDYDPFGRIESIDGPRTDVSDVTSFTYYPNEAGQGFNRANLYQVTNALGHVTTLENYNALGKPELITPSFGNPISMDYDESTGNLISKTQGSISTTYDYYDNGKLHHIYLPGQRTVTYTYTPSGKAKTITDGEGNTITFTYDERETHGKPVKVERTGANGQRQFYTDYTYEDTGDLDKIIMLAEDPINTFIFQEYDYDSLRNLRLKTDAGQNTTEYTYDYLNRLTSMIEPGAVTTSYSSNTNDNQTSVIDAQNKETTFTFDDYGRRTSRMSPDTGLTLYDYDLADNLVSATDSNGIVTNYEYDALNRLTTVRYPADPSQDITYTYDENGYTGLLASMHDTTGTTTYEYDLYGRLAAEIRSQGGHTFPIGYGYNDNSELNAITYPSGRVINYVHNKAGQVVTVTSTYLGATTTIAENIMHKPFGPLEEMNYGNGLTINNTYDLLYRLENMTAGSLYNRGYTYYDTGHVQAITDAIDSTASQSFIYDALGRLDTAQGKYGTYAWQYDTVGNRTQETHDTAVTTYTPVPGTNRLQEFTDSQATTSYTYDDVGNTLTKGDAAFTWNQNNRLVSATVNSNLVGTYGYDGRNLRTKRTVNGETIYSLYDQYGNLLSEIDSQGTVLREFAYLDDTRITLFEGVDPDFFTVEVTDVTGAPIEGAQVTPQAEAGSTVDILGITDSQGIAQLNQSQFDPGNYLFNITYADVNVTSPLLDVNSNAGLQAQLDIDLEPVEITVEIGGIAREGAVVTVRTSDGVPLNISGVTDSNGKVIFYLPMGGAYTFRVLYQGSFYLSQPLTVLSGGTAVTVDDTISDGNYLYPSILLMLLNNGGGQTFASSGSSAHNYLESNLAGSIDASPIRKNVVVAGNAAPAKNGAEIPEPAEANVPISGASAMMNVTAQFTIVSADFNEYYYINDHLNTAQLLVDEQGAVVWQGNYTPFGGVDVVVNNLENNFRFPGQYFDAETGLHYNWNRYYDPNTGRYISADPIGLEGGLNLYAYVGNNPVNYIDPEGKDPVIAFGIFTIITWAISYNEGIGDNFSDDQGNLFPGTSPQDWECSMGPLTPIGNACVLDRCINHDQCYEINECNYSSWIPSLFGGTKPCNQCNSDF